MRRPDFFFFKSPLGTSWSMTIEHTLCDGVMQSTVVTVSNRDQSCRDGL